MRTITILKTIKTVCGKTISYSQETGQIAKAHSTTGPAIVYAEDENKSPEYYFLGVKYSKPIWQSLVNQTKASAVKDGIILDY